MKKKSALFVVMGTLLLVALLGAFSQSGEDLFQRALRLERNEEKLAEAIELYNKVVADKGNEGLAAQAQLRIGLCYEKLGEKSIIQALGAFQKVVDNYPAQIETVREARKKLSSLSRVQSEKDVASGKFVIRKVWERSGNSISWDGRYVTFVEEHNLAVHDLVTGKIRRLTEQGSIESLVSADHSIFSPDGNQIAYEWFREDETWELCLIGLDGSGFRVLVHLDNGDGIYPCGWSPDGKRILVALARMGGPGSLTSEIAFVSVVDGMVEIIKPTHKTNFSTISGMSLSPDGRYIAYHAEAKESSRQNDLFLLSSEGGFDFPIVEHPANDRSPVWTPDGKKLLFISDREGAPGLWMMDIVDGKPQGESKLIRRDIGDIDKVLGFTSQGAFYFTQSISMGDIYVADLNSATGKIQGKPRVLVSRYAEKSEPAWSHDGKYLAFYRRTGLVSWTPGWRTLYIRSLETGEEHEFPNDLILYGGVQWFPDGQSLLISACRGEKDFRIDYYRVDVGTGETSLLMQRKDGAGSFWPGLSPNGKTIFFTYYKRESSDSYSGPGDCFLGAYQIENNQEKELCHILPQDQRERQSIAVSPDGRQLAFVVKEGPWPATSVIKIISPEGGQSYELFRSPWPGYIPGNQGLEWTPDGSHLLVVRGSMETEIGDLLRISLQDGEVHEMGLTAKMLSSPGISPDGRKIAFRAVSEAVNEIWVMENFLPKEENRR